jgi:ubiquinone/menaquinone biosynthesis C-methylase UbiE
MYLEEAFQIYEKYKASVSHTAHMLRNSGYYAEFNIKLPPIQIPEIIKEQLANNVISEIYSNYIDTVLDIFLAELDTREWIFDYRTAGRGGGWLIVGVKGPIGYLLTQGIPKNITEAFNTYYTSQVAQLYTNAKNLESLGKEIEERKKALVDELSSITFWEEYINNRYTSVDELSYEIDATIEAAICGHSIDMHTLSHKMLRRASLALYNKRISDVLAFNKWEIPYVDFAKPVKRFTQEYFGRFMSKYPELDLVISNLKIVFSDRPSHYPPDIAGELVSIDKIAYYLPPETLHRNWHGIVHEITHVVQRTLGGREVEIPRAPNVKRAGYFEGGDGYYSDMGEIHAHAVSEMYKDFVKIAQGDPLIENEFDDIKRQNYNMFKSRFDRYGDNGPNIFWSGKDAQNARFDAMLDITDFNGKRVLDVGCGFGDFIQHLETRGIKPHTYVGIDIVPEIVEVAERQNPNYHFEARDILVNPFDKGAFDIIIASGIFALPHRNYNDYVITMLSTLNNIANDFVIVNFLKKNDVEKDQGLKYHEPDTVLQMVQHRVSGSAQLKDDYLYNDFIIFINEQV